LYQRSWWRFFGFDLLQISLVQSSSALLRQVNFIDLWAKLRFSPTKLVIPWSRQNKKDFLGGGLAPKAYLFLGPPGSGKTLCAQALAGDAQVPLLCLSASEIQKQVESGTKIGPLRVRNLFQQTRAHTPCILFLDEIDSLSSAAERPQSSQSFSSADPALLGIKRAHFSSMKLTKERKKFQESSAWSSVHLQNHLNLQLALSSVEPNRAEVAEKTSTLSPSFAQQSSVSSELPPLSQSLSSAEAVNRIDATQKNPQLDSIDRTLVTEFLIQMDSFSLKDGFCIIGTTNFLDALDSAFIRSGRFDRLLGLSLPGKKSRQALFEFYSHPRSVGPALRMRVSANLTSIQPSSPHAQQSWFSRGIQLLTPWGLLRGMSQVSGALRVWPGTRRYSFQQPSTMDWKYWAEQTQGFSAADIAKIMNESFLHVIHTAISDSSKSQFNKVDAKLDHTPESIQKGIQTIVMSPRALGLLQES
jgi:SpoVK/Ycf46/Vps4 family AAA+-type ATPase